MGRRHSGARSVNGGFACAWPPSGCLLVCSRRGRTVVKRRCRGLTRIHPGFGCTVPRRTLSCLVDMRLARRIESVRRLFHTQCSRWGGSWLCPSDWTQYLSVQMNMTTEVATQESQTRDVLVVRLSTPRGWVQLNVTQYYTYSHWSRIMYKVFVPTPNHLNDSHEWYMITHTFKSNLTSETIHKDINTHTNNCKRTKNTETSHDAN